MAFFSRSFRRSVAALAAVATMLLLAFLPFVTSPKAIADVTATNVTQDGNFTNFARQGDIATIWIRDFSDNTQQGVFQGDAGFIETQDPGHGNMKVGAWSGTVNLKGTTQLQGGFSYTFKDAAILQDGSSADVKISYSNITIYTHKTENGPYTGDTYLAAATGKIHTANYNSVHIGVKMDVTVEVVNASGTFYFDSFGINTVRANQPNYQNIVGNDNNTVNGTVVGWNERLEFDADNIYVPANAQTTKFVLADNADTGHTAFSAIYSNGENGSDTNYGTGFATLTGSPSYTVTSWTGTGGFYGTPIKWNDINTRIMPGGITRKITSSSGEHGRVDTNVKGTDLSDAHPAITKAGGDPAKKDVLSVPNAKTVTYRMTPAPCYIIDTLTVDGNAVEPVTVKDSNGKILYYTYTGFGDSSDHTIHATWQPSVTVKATKTWSDYNNAYSSQPSTIDFQLKQGSTNVGSTVTVSDANSWEHTWYDLPKKNSGGTDYTYTVTETIPSTAPFSYESTSSSSTEVDSNNCPVITNTVTNTLKTADLTVTKNVTGDARDENDEFGFTITHGNGTTTVDAQNVQKKGDGTATTYAIPIGAQWTVTETGLNGYTPTSCSATGGTCSGNTSASGTMTATGASVTFTNTKYMPPATGMTGGGTPATWILIATIGGVGAFLTFAFRRTSRH